ncbi:unnamed protein product [Prorocentrum cordatum]|uniref:Uncharacterized protein n=1 Tax=Prorocentrum cordatum TaxID=2364126 RepID=A0ABN9P817_9DINO|nr:unnamed protein product [Polarella glacialis]
MHTEPLLGARRRWLLVDGIGCCVDWHSFWYRSWATTVTKEYLSSPISRRGLWKYCGIFVTCCLIADVVYALSAPEHGGGWDLAYYCCLLRVRICYGNLVSAPSRDDAEVGCSSIGVFVSCASVEFGNLATKPYGSFCL